MKNLNINTDWESNLWIVKIEERGRYFQLTLILSFEFIQFQK
jgi:hypothetical protein